MLHKLVKYSVNHINRKLCDANCWYLFKTGREPTNICSIRWAIEQWKRSLINVSMPTKGKIILSAIRNKRWVEWAVYSACFTLKMGYQPVIIYSGGEFKKIFSPKEKGGKPFRDLITSIPYLTLIDLDCYLTGSSDSAYSKFAEGNAHLVAAYDLKVEEYEPGDRVDEYNKTVEAARQMLASCTPAIEKLMREVRPLRVIAPSGLIGLSMAIREAARRASIDAIFVEGWVMRPGHNIYRMNQPALSYDIDGWLKVLGNWDNKKETSINDYMAFREGFEIHDEEWLKDFHQVQQSPKDVPLPVGLAKFFQRNGFYFLLGTNVVGDSATLGRATIFKSQQSWIKEIVGFFQEHPEMNLVIRAHPDEVWQKAKLRMGDVAAGLSAGLDNVYVIRGNETINTYSLVDRINAGLAWVSNIGLDMALRGKPVILAAAAQYSGLGICQVPKTKEEYFKAVLETVTNPIKPPEDRLWLGKAYHYIIFKMMSLKADNENYEAMGFRLGEKSKNPDQDRFYKILVGELDDKGRELA
ncbi:MAG: hypothetical protein V1843_03745 [bacterium]